MFYGSGVGPVTGDETVAQVRADRQYSDYCDHRRQERRGAVSGPNRVPGLDQINVRVPSLDSYGCAIPVAITTNGVAANVTTIPVALSGSICPAPAGTGVGPASRATQEEIDRWSGAGTFTTGAVNLARTTLYSTMDALPGVTGHDDHQDRYAGRIVHAHLRLKPGPLPSGAEGASAYAPSAGNCVVLRGLPRRSAPCADLRCTGRRIDDQSERSRWSHGSPRDGLAYNLRIPNLYMTAGRYTSGAAGGPSVGAFSGTFDVRPKLLPWPIRTHCKQITRSVTSSSAGRAATRRFLSPSAAPAYRSASRALHFRQ